MNSSNFVIVGAGSAGCALAYELARSGRKKVILLEAGGRDKSPYIKIPALVAHADKRYSWDYVSEPDRSRAGRSEGWVRGKVLGGSSSVNGMVFVRGAANDFDRWAAMGNEGWSYKHVLPLFQSMETSDQTGALRGRRGPLYVRTVKSVHPLTDAFVKSAVAAGFPFNADYNDTTQEGVSYIQLSQRRGLRFSAADAFIKPIRSMSNFSLRVNAHVDRILFDKGKAMGVSYRQGDAQRTILADQVILCAGSINTPKLLMLSGIGDEAELRRCGIDVVAHMPEVGKNLQEHPLVRLVFRSRISSHNLTRGVLQWLEIAAEFGLRREGAIATMLEAVAFLRTLPDLEHPDIQLHFAPMGYVEPTDDTATLLKYPSFSVLVNKNHPKSRGRVRLASNNPNEAPRIECNLLGDSDDLGTLVRGVSLVRKMMTAPPMADLIEAETMPGADNATDEALKRYIPGNTELGYHPVGTCRMGLDPAAVVTPQLRVNSLRNLWIADASIMPDLISGNTNAVCMMIGMKLGRYLSELPDEWGTG